MSKTYEIITERIIEMIEKSGHLPWQTPWKAGTMPIGFNRVSGKKYNGINAIMTAYYTQLNGFDSNEWITYNQAIELGGKIKKGSKGLPCVYFSMIDKKDKKGKNTDDDEDKIPLLKYSTIFNLAQCEGIDYKPLQVVEVTVDEQISSAEKILTNMKDAPTVVFKFANQAFYSAMNDEINLPAKGSFNRLVDYYSVLFHELTHSTGHKTRLDRGLGQAVFASKEYSKEELIAELGAAFLCSECGILKDTEDQSIAYLKNWLEVLRVNSRWLVSAAAGAQKSTNYILGVLNKGEKNK